MYKHLKGGCKRRWSQVLFICAQWEDQKQWAPAETQDGPCEHKEAFQTVRVTEPREGVKFPPWKRGHRQPALGGLAWVGQAPWLSRSPAPGDHQKSPPTSSNCGFVVSIFPWHDCSISTGHPLQPGKELYRDVSRTFILPVRFFQRNSVMWRYRCRETHNLGTDRFT